MKILVGSLILALTTSISFSCFAAPSISDLISNLHGVGRGIKNRLPGKVDCDIFPYGELQGAKRILYSFNYSQRRLYYGGPNDKLWSFDESSSTLHWGNSFEFIFEPVTFKLLKFRTIAIDGLVNSSCDIKN